MQCTLSTNIPQSKPTAIRGHHPAATTLLLPRFLPLCSLYRFASRVQVQQCIRMFLCMILCTYICFFFLHACIYTSVFLVHVCLLLYACGYFAFWYFLSLQVSFSVCFPDVLVCIHDRFGVVLSFVFPAMHAHFLCKAAHVLIYIFLWAFLLMHAYCSMNSPMHAYTFCKLVTYLFCAILFVHACGFFVHFYAGIALLNMQMLHTCYIRCYITAEHCIIPLNTI